MPRAYISARKSVRHCNTVNKTIASNNVSTLAKVWRLLRWAHNQKIHHCAGEHIKKSQMHADKKKRDSNYIIMYI